MLGWRPFLITITQLNLGVGKTRVKGENLPWIDIDQGNQHHNS